MNDKAYLYALLVGSVNSEALTTVEIDGKPEPVMGVWHNDIGLATSRIPYHSFAGLSRETLLNWLALHQTVLDVLHQEFTLIPVKMGTIIDSAADVRRILAENEQQFAQLLDTMTGKVEWNLVVSWQDIRKVLTAISEEQEIKSYKEALFAQGQVSREELIRVGEMVNTSLQRKKEAVRKKIMDELSPVTDNYYINETASEEIAANFSLLVNTGQEHTIGEKLTFLDQFYGGEMNFNIAGPLPPKSFATIEIAKVTREQLIAARDVLQLPGCASLSKIITAKRVLLHRHHPDTNTGVGDELIQEIIAAYRLLEEYLSNHYLSSLPENLADTYIVHVISAKRGAEG